MEDEIAEYLGSKEHKDKIALANKKASELIELHSEKKRPRKSNEQIQREIDDMRSQMRDEPAPSQEFLDENGKNVFEDKSDINFGGMPRRFKGSRGGLPPEPRKELKNTYIPSAPPTPREMYEMKKFDSAHPQRVPPLMTMKETEYNDREFSHTTDLVFRDLTTEEYREYMYNNGGVMRILQPWKLAISKSGNHRVATQDGFSYIIVPGWIAIRVKKKAGAPSFTF